MNNIYAKANYAFSAAVLGVTGVNLYSQQSEDQPAPKTVMTQPVILEQEEWNKLQNDAAQNKDRAKTEQEIRQAEQAIQQEQEAREAENQYPKGYGELSVMEQLRYILEQESANKKIKTESTPEDNSTLQKAIHQKIPKEKKAQGILEQTNIRS